MADKSMTGLQPAKLRPGNARPGFLPDLAPRIETERLILRGWRIEDYEPLAEMMADPDCGRYITSTSKPLDAVASWFNMVTLAGMWAVQGYGLFVMEEKATGRFVGRAGPFHPIAWPGFEVGWGLHPAGRGKGYATEAARAAITWSRATLGASDIVHVIAIDNAPSQAVARRLGAVPGERLEIFGRMSDVWVSRG
jgi:RimJ/RimL family protein N-acetyltransferase